MARILINVTHGTEHPTRAAFAFLIGKTAAEGGHEVSMFLVGDAVQLLRDEVLDAVTGVGLGRLREHYDGIVGAGGRFYVSRMSSNARGLAETDLAGKPVEMATPDMLVTFALEHDRVLTY